MAFHEVVFPEDYSRGVVGGPEFRTTVVATGSGHEQRNADWATARGRWDLSRLLYDETARAETIAFFRARRGRAYGFLFKDWADFFVGMAYDSTDTLVHNGSQNFTTGDGVETEFQMVKIYDSGGHTERRKITRPKSATVKVYLDGVEQAQPADCTVDYGTGVITFNSAPGAGVQIGWSGEFYVPVRFETDYLAIEHFSPTAGTAPLPVVEIRE